MDEHPLHLHSRRELQGSDISRKYQSALHATPDVISRLGLDAELQGHNGCVNCLEWSKDGSLLASGSDDCHVILWSALQHRKLSKFRTLHNGNIFSVKFLPQSRNKLLATGAADSKITVIDMEAETSLHVFTNHRARVKRLAVAEDEPHLLFSASEDGMVMQFDLRCPEKYAAERPNSVLVNLNHYIGGSAEVKCLSVCPTKTELLAVGCADPYARLYDRRMMKCSKAPTDLLRSAAEAEYNIPRVCVRYFVPGHVPAKIEDYSYRFRMLAATYCTFSPDGRDLLVNLGGEQIYLYDVNEEKKSYRLEVHPGAGRSNKGRCSRNEAGKSSNGYHRTEQSYTPFVLPDIESLDMEGPSDLPPRAEALKQKANAFYDKQKYAESIAAYNRALFLCPNSPVLYCNRAAALLKRNWNGDKYAAVNDCLRSIQLHRYQQKAYFRLARCLLDLGRRDEANACFNYFERLFPNSDDMPVGQLRKQLEEVNEKSKPAPVSEEKTEEEAEPNVPCIDKKQEKIWQRSANDYNQRFCGHCNTTTDIKEANFIGENGQYIAAGSDDGSFFIWERQTTNIVRTLRGDECIVNCVQPHPEVCWLATSGIDPVVRLWSPQPPGAKHDRSIANSHDAANLNQRRMNADPLEVMLMNMGQTIRRSEHDENDDGVGDMQCRPF